MRFLSVYDHENGGSMPLLALSANARLMVPVGAIDNRCELRRPCARILSFRLVGRRDAKVPRDRYRSALNSGNAPRSSARSADASYAESRIACAILPASSRAAAVS